MSDNKDFELLFDQLKDVDVKPYVEQKDSNGVKLSYLSWSYAVALFTERCPDWEYEIHCFDGKPYLYDGATGYMVFTSVTAFGKTKDMWLPVMDSHNAAMKAEPYTVKTKYREYIIKAATMMDINKTLMRCLVKNIAMFGLGLSIYAGEDLPGAADDDRKEAPARKAQREAEKQAADAKKSGEKDLRENWVLYYRDKVAPALGMTYPELLQWAGLTTQSTAEEMHAAYETKVKEAMNNR